MKKILYIALIIIFTFVSKPIFALSQDVKIYPLPQKVIRKGYEVSLDKKWKIAVDVNDSQLFFSAELLKRALMDNNYLDISIEQLNMNEKKKKIFLYISNNNTDDKIGEEGYILDIKESLITIEANQPSGIFYGVQSLIQLFGKQISENIKIPAVKIIDYPKTQMRGVHINAVDFSKIKKQLDLMSELKMNFAIIETWDYFDLRKNGNVDKVKDVYQYARQRYIEPIPEIVCFSHAAPFFVLDPTTAEATWIQDQEYIFGKNYAKPYTSRVYPLVNIIEENNSNIIVTNMKKDIKYKEHKDYLILEGDLIYPYSEDNKPTRIKRIPSGRIKENQKVLISFNTVRNISTRWVSWSVPYCPASKGTYEIIEEVFSDVIKLLSPKYISIGHDEIIGMNKDARTLNLEMTNEELLAFDINRIYTIARSINPNIKLMIWDDMLNPWHNGGDDAYQIPFEGKKGATSGAIKMIPKDIIILIWWYENNDRLEKMRNSIAFFKDYGFSYLVAAWNNRRNISEWVEIINKRDDAKGFIITTWEGFDKNYNNIKSVAGKLWTSYNQKEVK
jgi:hypothetical protein